VPYLLNDMPPERASRLFAHPLTQDAYGWVTQFLVDLRQCASYKDYVQFQAGLLDRVLEVQDHWDGCRRVAALLAKGRSVPADAPELRSGEDPGDPESWALENAVCERVDRHLRSVADALAWRAFNFDRRVIVALSRNQPAGPMVGKTGLAKEREFVEQWSADDNCFVLLHDLTSCLRIGDATLFRSVGEHFEAELHEIKTNPSRRNPAQLRRMKMAEDAIRSGGPLPGEEQVRTLRQLSVPYKTHLHMLQDAFRLAGDSGVTGLKVPGGRAVIAAYLPRGHELWSEEEFLAHVWEEREKAAGPLNVGEHVFWVSADEVARSAIHPPWGIYPLKPDVCAALIADLAIFVADILREPLVAALEDAGLRVQWVLPPGPQFLGEQPIMQIFKGTSAMEILPSEMQRLLLELVDLPTWVEGVSEVLSTHPAGSHPWPVFADEFRAWA
jgi:hypothetical protein